MKLNIKQKDCSYIIDPEKRKVYCNLNVDPFCVWNFITYNGYPLFSKKDRDRIMMPYSFTGTATCAPEDNWDVEVGKTIAFNRAKVKFCKSFFKRASYLVSCYDKRLDDIVDLFNDFGQRVTRNNEKRERRLAPYLMRDEDSEVQSSFGV